MTGPTNIGTTPTKRPLFRHPWRVAIVAVAVIAVLNLGAILIANSDTTPGGKIDLPTDVKSISPANGALASLVDNVTVDLADNLTGVLVIDGREIPEDQLDRIPELGVISFRPGPDKEFPRFIAGENTVVVKYWPRIKARPKNPPSYGWRFRAAA